ncbi:MAG: hypothetical protein FK730_17045 [Asgard group archaeon]|nr:hypothetical protein [Asgard group archaeon]
MNTISKKKSLFCCLILFIFFPAFIISYLGFNEIDSPGIKSEFLTTELLDEESESLNENLRLSSPLPPKNAYAIVIGISDYPGSDNDLSYCDDDAQDVYSMLINDYNFKTENIVYLQDSSASKSAIDTAFDQISSQITSNDIFFFYYSGHGGNSIVNEGVHYYSIDSPHSYYNNYDHTWSIYHPEAAYMRVYFDHFDLEYDYDYVLVGDTDILYDWYYEAYTGYSTGFWSGWIPLLSDNRIYIRMITDSSITKWGFSIDRYEVITSTDEQFLCTYDSIPSSPGNYYIDTLLDSRLDALNCDEKYIVLDACNTGGMIPEVQETGRYIMTACRSDEFSLEDPSLQHGVFTNYFLSSLDSATDSNGDGVRSMEERFAYTYSNTVSYSGSLGYTHHPQEYDGIAGEAVLATTFGSVSLNPVANQLSYSFNLYGIGQIQELKVAVCNVSGTTDYEIEDFTLNPSSTTGFGFYSGTIELDGFAGITGYGIYAQIEGNRMINLNITVSGDSDADSLDDVLEVMLSSDPFSNDSDSDGLEDASEYYGITDPSDPDTDDDGLLDGQEILTYLTDPLDPDMDDDGLLDGLEILTFLTDPLDPDTDGDGMNDGYEAQYGLDPLNDDASLDTDSDGINNFIEFQNNTDPNDPDTDDDNLSDGLEILTYFTNATNPDTDYDNLSDDLEILTYFTDANDADTDDDNLSDGLEILTYFTNATNPDTDSDNLLDGDEVFTYFTDANDADTDNDNLSDGLEILTYFTNATNPDTDYDNLSDDLELFTYFTNPSSQDTDSDILSDYEEIIIYLTNATNPDTEGDGMGDYYEILYSLDPFLDDSNLDHDNDGLINLIECQCGSSPLLSDSDGDFMSDYYEFLCELDITTDDADGDYDQDGLNNILEFLLGSLANDEDSDNDNMPDYWEYNNNLNLTTNDSSFDYDYDDLSNYIEFTHQLDPHNPDCDNDGLTDGEEILIYHTNPLDKDTDGDGYSDGIEVLWGTNPLDPKISLNTYFFNIAGAVVLVSTSYYVVRTQVMKKKQNKEQDKLKPKKFSFDTDIKKYNALTVEKKLKPKPVRPVYQQRTRVPSYYRPSTTPTYTNINTIKDIILNRLPPPKPSYSSEGKRALIIANMAFNSINQGRYKQSFEYMVNALILGVPEPMNSRIKKILLDSLNRGSSSTTSSSSTPPSYNDPLESKKCAWCGKINQKSNVYCVSCGKVLKKL